MEETLGLIKPSHTANGNPSFCHSDIKSQTTRNFKFHSPRDCYSSVICRIGSGPFCSLSHHRFCSPKLDMIEESLLKQECMCKSECILLLFNEYHNPSSRPTLSDPRHTWEKPPIQTPPSLRGSGLPTTKTCWETLPPRPRNPIPVLPAHKPPPDLLQTMRTHFNPSEPTPTHVNPLRGWNIKVFIKCQICRVI